MSEREIIIPEGSEAVYERWHFAPAVRKDGTLYGSGQIGTGPDGKASEDPETQFTQAFESVQRLLEAAGASLRDVVEMTTYHVGLQENMRAFMKVKDRFVEKPYPAWTAIGVTELAIPGGLVEIRVIAKP